MKRMVFAGAFLMAISAFGQGSVVFNNRVVGTIIAKTTLLFPDGSMAGITDGVPYADAKWEAQLFGGPEGSTLVPLFPKTTFRTGAAAGYVVSAREPVIISGVAPGAKASLQMKAFTSDGFYSGSSKVFSLTAGGGPFPPSYLVGLEAFSVIVPEPSTIPLGILASIGLFLIRHRASCAHPR